MHAQQMTAGAESVPDEWQMACGCDDHTKTQQVPRWPDGQQADVVAMFQRQNVTKCIPIWQQRFLVSEQQKPHLTLAQGELRSGVAG